MALRSSVLFGKVGGSFIVRTANTDGKKPLETGDPLAGRTARDAVNGGSRITERLTLRSLWTAWEIFCRTPWTIRPRHESPNQTTDLPAVGCVRLFSGFFALPMVRCRTVHAKTTDIQEDGQTPDAATRETDASGAVLQRPMPIRLLRRN